MCASIGRLLALALLLCGACASQDEEGGGVGGGDAGAGGGGGTGGSPPRCEGCEVEGGCVAAGVSPAGNGCLVCDPARAADAWSDADGLACDDGKFCNGPDRCLAGACAEHPAPPCADDGLFCDGQERCDELLDACVPGAPPCADDGAFCNGEERCDEATAACHHGGDPCEAGACVEAEARCCTPEVTLGCSPEGDVAWLDSCGRVGETVERCSHAPDALCLNGRCGCMPGWSGPDCETCVRYVDGASGDDGALGTEWARALRSVQAGIDAAAGGGCEVWIREGVYVPSATGDRSVSFHLAPDVALIGGFAGDERSLEARDPLAHPTVLSGELGDPALATDNSSRVLVGADGARLSALTIRAGYMGMEAWNVSEGGAGLMARDLARGMTIEACRFEDHDSIHAGGAIWVSGAPLVIEDTLFARNHSARRGGAIFLARRGPVAGPTVVRRTRFVDNRAEELGGGLSYQLGYWGDGWEPELPPTADLVVERSLFSGNTASLGGGICALFGDAPAAGASVRSSTFAGNRSAWEGALSLQRIAPGATAELVNSIVWGNSSIDEPFVIGTSIVSHSDVEGAGFDGTDGNLSVDPLFVAPEEGADLRLGPGSPCIDAGDDARATPRDLDGLPPFDDPTVDHCPIPAAPSCGAATDLGAFERQD